MRRTAGKKTMIDTAIAISTDVGSRNADGGVRPRMRSRMIPPPTAVVTPRTQTPKMSICFFRPVIAPVSAKEIVPMISKIKISRSMLVTVFYVFLAERKLFSIVCPLLQTYPQNVVCPPSSR